MSGTTFSFQYFISIILALGGAFAADQNLPNMNPIIKLFVIPLFIAYITLLFMNTFLPKFTKWAEEVGSYVEDKAYLYFLDFSGHLLNYTWRKFFRHKQHCLANSQINPVS